MKSIGLRSGRRSLRLDPTPIISYAKLNDLLLRENWDHVLSESDPSVSFSLFIDDLKGKIALSTTVPRRNTTRRLKPWMTNELLKAVTYKNKLYKRKKRRPNNLELEREYAMVSKRVADDVEMVKSSYYSNRCFEAAGDGRAQWKIINELAGSGGGGNAMIDRLTVNGAVTDNRLEMANALNMFFVNTPQDLIDKHLCGQAVSVADPVGILNSTQNSIPVRLGALVWLLQARYWLLIFCPVGFPVSTCIDILVLRWLRFSWALGTWALAMVSGAVWSA
ncbi:hypothetical protein DMENIID0001_163120 [Sergentomyia squamirostris]